MTVSPPAVATRGISFVSPSAGEGSYFTRLPSPLGELLLLGTETALTGISMADQSYMPELSESVHQNTNRFTDVSDQLAQYFAGERKHFDLTVAVAGTGFQQSVWRSLLEIPYGATTGYGEIADRIGHPRASRAVGSANGRNPLAVVIPCHRVIAADGSLGGYGGGLDRKRLLLKLEAAAA